MCDNLLQKTDVKYENNSSNNTDESVSGGFADV